MQAFAGVAVADADLDMLQGILDGTAVPEGLSVDADLRWTLMHALVSGGRQGAEDIEAELRRDATATGERSAAMCRAALPTAEGKAAAWASILSGTLANAVFRSTVAGFQDPNHPELLEPYREKYFAEVSRLYKEWTFDSAQGFAVGCFPSLLIEQETVDAAQRFLTTAQPPQALRRMVLEGADGVSRAMRNRAAF